MAFRPLGIDEQGRKRSLLAYAFYDVIEHALRKLWTPLDRERARVLEPFRASIQPVKLSLVSFPARRSMEDLLRSRAHVAAFLVRRIPR